MCFWMTRENEGWRRKAAPTKAKAADQKKRRSALQKQGAVSDRCERGKCSGPMKAIGPYKGDGQHECGGPTKSTEPERCKAKQKPQSFVFSAKLCATQR